MSKTENREVQILFTHDDPDKASVLDVFGGESLEYANIDMLRMVHPAGAALYRVTIIATPGTEPDEGTLGELVGIL